MNSLLPSSQPVSLTLPPAGRGLLLVLGTHLRQVHPAVLEQAARLALTGPLQILDGGNCLDLYGLARQLRRLDPHVEPLLRRIQVVRPFTCYQMTTLLAQLPCLAFEDERQTGKREEFGGLREVSLLASPQAPAGRREATLASPQTPVEREMAALTNAQVPVERGMATLANAQAPVERGMATLAEPKVPAGRGEDCLPTIVLDLLATFLDENVRLPERQRLLADCLRMLQRLAGSVPVLITAHLTTLPDSESLVNMLSRAADQLWTPPPPLPAPTQLRLFP
jgi:hypothetical protein